MASVQPINVPKPDPGYRVRELSGASEIKVFLESLLRYPLTELHRYHQGDITELQYGLSRKVLETLDIVRLVIMPSLTWFNLLVGRDLKVQKYPYLRIARPNMPRDNIGIHRDTWYGASPYEVSCSLALTQTDEGSALRVVPGSQSAPDSDYPTFEEITDVEKGSKRHQLGFVYKRKHLQRPVDDIPVPLGFGSALIFGSSLVHGQEVNASNKTRVSIDIRLVNTFAPHIASRSVHSDYYIPLCEGEITRHARLYEENQEKH